MKIITIIHCVFLNVLALIFLVACSSYPKIPVEGELFGKKIKTTVDSEIARYYIEDYLQGKNSNPRLDKKIEKLYGSRNGGIPTREELKLVAEEYSVDFSAMYFADRLLENEGNKNIQTTFDYFLENKGSALTMLEKNAGSYVVLFVPGWDYIANGHLTGADFAEPRRLVTVLGIENYLVEAPSNGSVEDIADYLTADLLKHSQTGKDIIIVGASSAGPAIYLCLADKLKISQKTNIKAWLNLGGILKGSPLIDHYQQWPQSWLFGVVAWYNGWDIEKVYSMSSRISRNRFEKIDAINHNILIVNYLGIPLSGQLSQYSKDKYLLLSSDGPNDGLTLLADVVVPNSLTIVAMGSDHFFAEDPNINDKTIALMKVVISYLRPGKIASAQNRIP